MSRPVGSALSGARLDGEPLIPLRYRPSAAEIVALAFTAVSAAAFLAVRPPVGDLFAARARESAARHGVGLRYWFAWFDGSTPGRYSVIEPYVAAVVGSVLLGVLSAIAVAGVAFVALATTRHRAAAMGFVAIGVFCNLWSGRIPFLFGTVFALIGIVLVQRRRPVLAAVVGVLVALITPTAAVFLVLSLLGVLVVDRSRRLSALAGCLGAGIPVLIVAAYFGSPGPQGFQVHDAVLVMIGMALMLMLRTPPQVRITVAVSLVATLIVLIIPNGLGANIQRLDWFCLTAACVATSRGRRVLTFGAAGFTIVLAVIVTARDLDVAAKPTASPSFYDRLNRHLDSISGLDNFRIETVFDGTHNAAYALLGHVQQARGYETQSDKEFNRILTSPDLDARRYRVWLDDNAVGYVVISRNAPGPSTEDDLVRNHRPGYLRQVWSDAGLTLYAVDRPTPIVAPPATMVSASQSALTLQVPSTGGPTQVLVRVRWSRLLHIRDAPPGSQLSRSPGGWTMVDLPAPCTACRRSARVVIG